MYENSQWEWPVCTAIGQRRDQGAWPALLLCSMFNLWGSVVSGGGHRVGGWELCVRQTALGGAAADGLCRLARLRFNLTFTVY